MSEEGLFSDFATNPGQPQYLTPVFFRKAVLDKYYKQNSIVLLRRCAKFAFFSRVLFTRTRLVSPSGG